MYLTKRQKEIVEYLRRYLRARGYAPTFDEIARQFGFRSKGTVYKHIKALQRKGLVRHEWNRTRSLELTVTEGGQISLPVLGWVSAGRPLEAVQDTEQLEVPSMFLRSGNHYLLKVKGNSMLEEQIRDGDLVVVQEKTEAANGETVVALIDESEVTIKKFFRRDGEIELRPANEKLKSVTIPANRVRIQGVVVGVMRRYGRGG
ncbi:MAG: transcriptional repressor LexA [Fidelibacterota bacterium]